MPVRAWLFTTAVTLSALVGTTASVTAQQQPTMSTLANVNEFDCRVFNNGQLCSLGFWPRGTSNQYMYKGGMEVFGLILAAPGCTGAVRQSSMTPTCFKWSGDTTGAYLYEFNENNHSARPLTPIYNSLSPEDLAAWPAAGSIPDFPAVSAFVLDTAVFDATQIGRKSISEQDTWAAYWDGDAAVVRAARTHAMGVLVEQRTLAWNYPDGNEATVYQIFRITNITNNPRFQREAEAVHYGGLDSLPNAGWRIDSIFFSYSADPDIGPATNNNLSAVLPLNTMFAYERSFNDPAFRYPPAQFHAPFFTRAPGLMGMSIVRSPRNPATGRQNAMTALSAVSNGGAFPTPGTVAQGWRYASLNIDPSKQDGSCFVPSPRARRVCYLPSTPTNRFYMGSGPFSLEPGKSETVIVAVFAAAAVATTRISPSPSTAVEPGIPGLAPGCNGEPIRPIETVAGYIAPLQCPAAGAIEEPRHVSVVPGSLLGKALVARTLADRKFALPSAPAEPAFALEPGNNEVTIVWEPSETETTGDPFHDVASDSTRGLLDPNYRKYDVEGYRIYRGTSRESMKLVAQFDKRDTELVDVRCVTEPEHIIGTPCTSVHRRALSSASGDLVQYRVVAQTISGSPLLISADTAFAGERRAGTALALQDNGVPYRFTDTSARNGFTYYYKVTAFDFNSIHSSPSSLESAGSTKPTVPRAASAGADDLSKIHAVPDPYYATSLFDRGPTRKEIQFVNLPARAVVRIYSLAGVLVHTVKHEDESGGGRETWNLRTPNGTFAASGVYIFHISTPEGRSAVGKFTVIAAQK